MQPTVANTSDRCNDATQRCKHISQLQFPADILPTFDFPPQRPPSSREGDRPQAVEGVRTRCFYAEYLFLSTYRTYEAYEVEKSIFRKGGGAYPLRIVLIPRVQGRNPARFKGGYGVPRGFKGGSKPSAPCGRLSEAEHPKRKGATLLRPLSAVNRNLPGNSHSRASAPCDFRFPPCFFPHSGRMAPIPLIP